MFHSKEVAQYKKTLKTKYGIVLGKLLGYGSEGYVYQISKQRVAKLTDNYVEAQFARRLMRHKKLPSFFPKVYRVIELSNPYGYDWVIVREPIDDVSDPGQYTEMTGLGKWCISKKVVPTDLHPDNVGVRTRTGQLVIRDLGAIEPLDKHSIPTEPWNKE